MARLKTHERAFILAVLAEGNSVSSTSRITGTDKETILKLLVDISAVCRGIHNHLVRKLHCRKIEADEMWSFIYKKEKRAKPDDKAAGFGDAWLWIATDIDTKLIVSYLVGDRGRESADIFMEDLAARLTHRVQITTDGLATYAEAVGSNFGTKADFVRLRQDISNLPNVDSAVTSHVERLNLTIRMTDRRFTRKTNGFSKKYQNHCASVDFHVVYYNFIRVHMSLDVTPAMEAKITDHVWTYVELVELLEREERKISDAPMERFRSLIRANKAPT